MNKNSKEKGTMVIFVVIAIIFIIAVLIGFYTKKSQEVVQQDEQIQQIQQRYEQSFDPDYMYEQTQEKQNSK